MICGKISDLKYSYSDMFENAETEQDYPIDLIAFEKVLEYVADYARLALFQNFARFPLFVSLLALCVTMLRNFILCNYATIILYNMHL